MSDIPEGLRYTSEHEWVREEDDGTLTVGITEHAQSVLGDLVFIELPETGAEVAVGDACGVVESVKSASDVYAPLGGTIAAVNDVLGTEPEVVNQDPYGEGWLFRIEPDDAGAFGTLLDAAAYADVVAAAE